MLKKRGPIKRIHPKKFFKLAKLKDVHKKNLKNTLFPRKKKFFKGIFILYFIIAILIISLLFLAYYYFFSTKAEIKKIEINGVDTEMTQKIHKILNNQLKTPRYLFFNQENKYFLNKKETIKNISEILSYKQILINILGNTLIINLTELPGSLYWKTNNNIYLINNEGIPLKTVPELVPYVEHIEGDKNIYFISIVIKPNPLPIIYDNSNTFVEINKVSIPSDLINKILNLNSKFSQQKSLKIISYEINNISGYEIIANTLEGFNIKINLNNDLDQQLKRLKTLLNTEIRPEQRLNLKYIDLRNEEKVYYK